MSNPRPGVAWCQLVGQQGREWEEEGEWCPSSEWRLALMTLCSPLAGPHVMGAA